MTALLGNCGFLDSCLPVKGKSEWGMDTLTRKMEGARSLAQTFIATLSQGQAYEGYYLQTWEADDNPVKATITLIYKGLLTGGTPLPDVQRSIVPSKGSTSAEYSDENDGLGRLYRRDLIWTTTGDVPAAGNFGTTAAFYRDRYAVSAVMEFTYKAVEARYRYITVGAPFAANYNTVGISYTQIVEDARITTSDGTIYGYDRAVFFGLLPIQLARVVGFTSKNVIGTPYWECEDIVRLELTQTYPGNLHGG